MRGRKLLIIRKWWTKIPQPLTDTNCNFPSITPPKIPKFQPKNRYVAFLALCVMYFLTRQTLWSKKPSSWVALPHGVRTQDLITRTYVTLWVQHRKKLLGIVGGSFSRLITLIEHHLFLRVKRNSVKATDLKLASYWDVTFLLSSTCPKNLWKWTWNLPSEFLYFQFLADLISSLFISVVNQIFNHVFHS